MDGVTVLAQLTRTNGGSIRNKAVVTLPSKSVTSDFPEFACCGVLSLISVLNRLSSRTRGNTSGFAEISTKCASARLITQFTAGAGELAGREGLDRN
jgi:hypothetical protein